MAGMAWAKAARSPLPRENPPWTVGPAGLATSTRRFTRRMVLDPNPDPNTLVSQNCEEGHPPRAWLDLLHKTIPRLDGTENGAVVTQQSNPQNVFPFKFIHLTSNHTLPACRMSHQSAISNAHDEPRSNTHPNLGLRLFEIPRCPFLPICLFLSKQK